MNFTHFCPKSNENYKPFWMTLVRSKIFFFFINIFFFFIKISCSFLFYQSYLYFNHFSLFNEFIHSCFSFFYNQIFTFLWNLCFHFQFFFANFFLKKPNDNISFQSTLKKPAQMSQNLKSFLPIPLKLLSATKWILSQKNTDIWLKIKHWDLILALKNGYTFCAF